jgi:putative spermidine/putrescine transport system permease protein
MHTLERRHRIILGISVAAVLLFLMLPVLIIFPLSFGDSSSLRFPPPGWSLRWYEVFFDSARWLAATRFSFQIAILTVLIAVPIGVAASYGLMNSRIAQGRYVYMLLMTPMIVPIIIIGIGVFFICSYFGLIGSVSALVMAHVLLAIPYVLLTVGAGLRSFDRNQEMAARSLGVTRLRAFLTVTLPQIKTSVVVACIFTFLSSLDEVVVALFIARGETTTLTREMFLSIREQIEPTIAAVSSLLVSATVLLAAVAYAVQKRSATPGGH